MLSVVHLCNASFVVTLIWYKVCCDFVVLQNSKAPLHLTTNSSGIGTLTNKHNRVFEGLQYTVYNGPAGVSKANDQGLHTAQPVIFKGSVSTLSQSNNILGKLSSVGIQHANILFP